MSDFKREVCLENITLLEKAIASGADRIELCNQLEVGGTTVSYGMAQYAIHRCAGVSIPVMLLIRPRAGDFVFNESEITVMLSDIKQLKELKPAGFVIGCLTQENAIDLMAMERLVSEARPHEVTFHMAFDQVADPYAAIDQLFELGVSRILMHGTNSAIEDNCAQIASYIAYAANRLIIMPGGGVTTQNALQLHEATGAKELHGTRLLW